MELLNRINADLKEAMLAKDAHAVATLRFLKSDIQNAQIAVGDGFDDDGIMKVIRSQVKKRGEAAETYRGLNNEEKALQEESEAIFLKKYLPAEADPVAVEAFVSELAATGAAKGDLIRQTIQHFKGTADGKTVSEIVNRLG